MLFIIPNVVIFALRADEINGRMVLITVPVCIWACRLSWYIFKRYESEDWRYEKVRKMLEEKGDCAYYVGSFFGIFVG